MHGHTFIFHNKKPVFLNLFSSSYIFDGLLLLTVIELSLSGSSPYTSTNKTNKNVYTCMKQYKNPEQTIQTQ
jgi:hypothetical protein